MKIINEHGVLWIDCPGVEEIDTDALWEWCRSRVCRECINQKIQKERSTIKERVIHLKGGAVLILSGEDEI